MAVGDPIGDIVSVPAGGFLDIRPPTGETWHIANIMTEAKVELQRYDGTNTIVMEAVTAATWWSGLQLKPTYNDWYRVKNTDTVARLISYDGFVWKAAP